MYQRRRHLSHMHTMSYIPFIYGKMWL